ncbi:MAG: hypothetical protein ACI4R8_01115 [Candidatus Caccovivens sp.]
MINLIRKSSDTPNIQNYDDIRAFKYAGCGQNGVVKDYLNACGYEISGQNFTIKSGEIILDGWQVGIDTSGWTGTINNLSGTVYYTVYLEIDTSITGSETAKIIMTYDTVTYPQIDIGQNLSTTNMGIGRLVLYHFQAIDNVILNVQQVFKLLDGEAFIAKYASSDYSKGTIEERLTNLGFRKGSFIVKDISTVSVDGNGEPYGTVQLTTEINEIKRQGNYCIANLKLQFTLTRNPNYSSSSSSYSLAAEVNVPEEFRPIQDITSYTAGTTSEVSTGYVPHYIHINSDGSVKYEFWSYWSGSFITTNLGASSVIANIGWEAAPIT